MLATLWNGNYQCTYGHSKPKQKRCFTLQNVTKFNEMLKNIGITLILAEDNTNFAYELLMSNYKKAFN